MFLIVLVSQIWLLRFSYHLSGKLKALDVFWMFSEDYRRGVCLDD